MDSGYRKKPQRSKRKKEPKRESYRLRPSHAFVTLTAIVFLALFTLVPYASLDLDGTGKARPVSVIDMATATADLKPDQPRYAPPDGWMEALTYLKDNTDQPFGDADFYYSRYERPFDYSAYPEAYGVIAWWDYGYWIVRIGQRPPSQNPGGAIPSVAEFFLAQDESEGQRILDEQGARYVILDFEFVTGKFHGAISVTGRSQDGFYDSFVEPVKDAQGNVSYYQRKPYYFPEYYRSMSVRLYCFGGKAVTPGTGDCKVLKWKTWEREGKLYKLVFDKKDFDSPEEASVWIAEEASGEYNYNIVGENPFESPVTLEEMEGFALRYDSDTTKKVPGGYVSQVRIFEYVK